MTAAGRRTELIRILRGRRKDTVKNLAYALGVTERTIRRDLLTLTLDEGYHIDVLPGNGGGVVFHSHSNPHKGILSQEQIDVLTELAESASTHQSKVLREILDAYA
ncbi:MAG: HTH domain-containing protein [Oscillospiraceae bacterium]|nr:HTH domain-containing protein [Oscillospiraceae bacterium]